MKPLAITQVPIGDVQPHPDNARRGDVQAIIDSIQANGLYKPIIVQRSTGHILAGNHTYRALAALKHVEVPVVYVDVDDERARRILLIDNRASDLATYDDAALADLLEELAFGAQNALEGTGYSTSDLAALRRELDTSLVLPDGSTVGRQVNERVYEYEQASIRQIVLVLSSAEFVAALATLADMQHSRSDLDSNTACFLYLARRWAEAHSAAHTADADPDTPGDH